MRNRVLAIDPGTREMGIALLDSGELVYHGVKTIRRLRSPHDRLRLARRIILQLIRDFQPTVVVSEKTFFARNRNCALLNVLYDEIRALARRNRIAFFGLAPSSMKKIVSGNGHATKAEIATVVAARFPELKAYLSQDRKWKLRYHHNMFDAVALGLAYAKTSPAG